MKTIILSLALLIGANSCALVSNRPTITASGGQRNYGGGHSGVDNQDAYGLAVHTAGKNDFGLEVGVIGSKDDRNANTPGDRLNTVEIDNLEFYAGLRKNFQLNPNFVIGLSGGAAYTDVNFDLDPTFGTSVSKSDYIWNPYAQADISMFVHKNIDLMGIYRRNFLGDEVDLVPSDGDSDVDTLMLGLSFSF